MRGHAMSRPFYPLLLAISRYVAQPVQLLYASMGEKMQAALEPPRKHDKTALTHNQLTKAKLRLQYAVVMNRCSQYVSRKF